MSIVRVHKRPDRYTRIDNRIIEDERLGMDALGLLTYLLSKPDTWQVRAADIQRRFGTGKHKPYTALKELQVAGYASWSRDSSGKTTWDVYDDPNPENRDKGKKPHPEKPDQENRDVLVSTEKKVTTDRGIPAWINSEIWQEFATHRKEIKASLTPTATRRLLANLDKHRALGVDPNEAILESIKNQWRGVFPERLLEQANGKSRQGTGNQAIRETATERSQRIERETLEKAARAGAG